MAAIGHHTRAARSYEQVRAVFWKITTWNSHIYRFDEYLTIQPLVNLYFRAFTLTKLRLIQLQGSSLTL